MRFFIIIFIFALVDLSVHGADGTLQNASGTTTLGATISVIQAWKTNVVDGSYTNVNANSVNSRIEVQPNGTLTRGDNSWVIDSFGNGTFHNVGTIDGLATIFQGGSVSFDDGGITSSGGGTLTAGAFVGDGSGLTSLNASQLTSGTLSQSRFGITNFTVYASGTAYTLTGSSAQLTFGTTSPIITINQTGTYLIHANVGVKYNGATYTAAQTVTFKLRRTNNTAADLTSGSRAVELPVLTTFTGGDVMTLPPVIYAATSGDTIGIFGVLSATPAAGSVLADSSEVVAIRLF